MFDRFKYLLNKYKNISKNLIKNKLKTKLKGIENEKK